MALTPAVFLDKDGTLLEDVPYNVDPTRMHFTRGARRGLSRLARLELPLIVISNQPGVALGKFDLMALTRVRLRLRAMFQDAAATLAGFYYCAHHPQGSVAPYARVCDCRKPAPGLLLRAAREHGIDLERSWFVGDILNDVEAGQRAGCATILLNNGHETEWEPGPYRKPDFVAADLDEAALIIFERDTALRGNAAIVAS